MIERSVAATKNIESIHRQSIDEIFTRFSKMREYSNTTLKKAANVDPITIRPFS